jgi:hypothetical protein
MSSLLLVLLPLPELGFLLLLEQLLLVWTWLLVPLLSLAVHQLFATVLLPVLLVRSVLVMSVLLPVLPVLLLQMLLRLPGPMRLQILRHVQQCCPPVC